MRGYFTIICLFFASFFSLGYGKDFYLKNIKTGFFGPNLYFNFVSEKDHFDATGNAEFSGSAGCVVDFHFKNIDHYARRDKLSGSRKVEYLECSSAIQSLKIIMEYNAWFDNVHWIRLECSLPKSQVKSCLEVKLSHINEALQTSPLTLLIEE